MPSPGKEVPVQFTGFLGTNVSVDPATLPHTVLQRSENFVPTNAFTLARRPGIRATGNIIGFAEDIPAAIRFTYQRVRYTYLVANIINGAFPDLVAVSINDGPFAVISNGYFDAAGIRTYDFALYGGFLYCSNGINPVKQIAVGGAAEDLTPLETWTDVTPSPTVDDDVLSVLAAAYFQNQERVQRRLVSEKEEQRGLARQSLYFAHIRVAHEDWQTGQIPRVRDTLRQHVPRAGEPDLRGWEWYYLLSLCQREERLLAGHSNGVASVSAHPDRRWVASGGGDGVVRIWDAQSGEVRAELKGHRDQVMSVFWSPDGGKLGSGGIEGKLILWDPGSFLKIAELDCDREIWAMAWSPGGNKIAAGGILDADLSDGRMTIWDVASGRRLRYLKGNGIVWSMAWHPAGRGDADQAASVRTL